MKRTTKSAATYILAAVLAVLLFISSAASSVLAYADEPSNFEYTDVLDDLNKSQINLTDYPQKDNDYTIDIITIAESVNGELFIYVYQPGGSSTDLRASSINISTETGDLISYFNYDLQLINSSGVFYKYIVKNFTVKNDEVRYYSITSIYRPFIEGVDEQAGYDNKITEVPFAVSRQYGITTVDGQTTIECLDIETIVIDNKFVGYASYTNGFHLNYSRCHSHFVAFSTDRPIDKLIEAEVHYTTQSYYSYTAPFSGTEVTWGDVIPHKVKLNYKERVEHEGGLLPWLHKTYTWDRIETVSQFISEVDNASIPVYSGVILNASLGNQLTDDARDALRDKQWVLRFAETSFDQYTGDGITTNSLVLVGDVTILSLKFEHLGKTFNLGVIDNKQTGSGKPVNEYGGLETNLNFWIIGAFIIAALIIFLILYKEVTNSKKEN